MIIERTDNEIVLRIPSNIDTIGFQRIINYLKYKEATVNSNVEVDELSFELRIFNPLLKRKAFKTFTKWL